MLLKRDRHLLELIIVADAQHLLLQALLQLFIVPCLKPNLQTVADRLLRRLALRLSIAPFPHLVQNTGTADLVALIQRLTNHGENDRLPELAQLIVHTDYAMSTAKKAKPSNCALSSPPLQFMGSSHRG